MLFITSPDWQRRRTTLFLSWGRASKRQLFAATALSGVGACFCILRAWVCTILFGGAENTAVKSVCKWMAAKTQPYVFVPLTASIVSPAVDRPPTKPPSTSQQWAVLVHRSVKIARAVRWSVGFSQSGELPPPALPPRLSWRRKWTCFHPQKTSTRSTSSR